MTTVEDIPLMLSQEPSDEPMRKFRVVLEQLSEEIIEVEAEDEYTAVELAVAGHGTLVEGVSIIPTIVHTEELYG